MLMSQERAPLAQIWPRQPTDQPEAKPADDSKSAAQ
jgi:hypothetical protein